MTEKTKQLKQFINNFNYPDPSWESLPKDFPNCNTKDLTPHEEGLYSAIQLIWYANHDGRPALLKRFSQSMLLIMAMITSGVILRNIIVSDMFGRVVTVNAATVSGTLRTFNGQDRNENEFSISPSQILDSTVSGLLKK